MRAYVQTRTQSPPRPPMALFLPAVVSYPIFLPAPNATFDWGCNRQPTDCPPGVCWLPEEGLKLWGLALGLISLDHLEVP